MDIVNLLSSTKKVETLLSAEFEIMGQMHNQPQVGYAQFDFHSLCKSSYSGAEKIVKDLRPTFED